MQTPRKTEKVVTTTAIKIKLGVPSIPPSFPFDPEVDMTIDGDHALALEVMEYLEEFTSPAGQIEVR